MVILENGSVPDGKLDDKAAIAKVAKLKKQIKGYISGYIDKLVAGEMPAPDGGDCWDCLMVAEDGRTLGEFFKSDHLLKHMEESYYVPSLLRNAAKESDMSPIAKSLVAEAWEGKPIEGWAVDIVRDQVRSSLKRYLHLRLGLPA